MELKISALLDLSHTLAGDYLAQFEYPWQALDGIKDFILALGPTLSADEYDQPAPNVWVHKTAKVFPSAYLGAPCIIGPETEVRHCAFIRGSALVGANCVVGNSVELKNVILFDNVQTPHYNYVGDSILGFKSHMGAGSSTSNVKSDKTLVVVKNGEEQIETGRKKFGAILGDHVEVGCNSVLNPGTILGRNTSVYPTSSVRGAVPPDSIFRAPGNIAGRKCTEACRLALMAAGFYDDVLSHMEKALLQRMPREGFKTRSGWIRGALSRCRPGPHRQSGQPGQRCSTHTCPKDRTSRRWLFHGLH